MIGIALLTLLFVMALLILRGIVGVTTFDRILVANSFGTVTVVFIVLLGELLGVSYFLDVAIVYALINFIATIALMRYFKYGAKDNA